MANRAEQGHVLQEKSSVIYVEMFRSSGSSNKNHGALLVVNKGRGHDER